MSQKQGYRNGASVKPRGSNAKRTERYSKKGSKKPLKAVILIAVCIGVLIFSAVYLNMYLTAKGFDSVFLPNIYIDDISLSGMTLEEGRRAVFSAMEARENSWSLALTYQGHTYYTMTYATMGLQSDTQQAIRLLNEAYSIGHTGGTFERYHDIQDRNSVSYSKYTSSGSMTTELLDNILGQIADNMYREPQDAYLAYFNPDDEDPFEIFGEQNGYKLDTEKYKQLIMQYISNGTSGMLELIPDILSPTVSTADVRNQLCLLGTGTTPISSFSTENRNNNIRVAFSRYNGLIVPNGEKVSFNNVVGERTIANGFYEADEYVNGNLTIGIGGGVCQASSTIYKAALLSNLRINKREPHSEEVSYTVFGQDATVYWGGRKIDFEFTNNTGGTLYITAHVEQTGKNILQCVVKFYGRSLGEGVYYTLDTRTVEEILMPEEPVYEKDKKQQYVTYTDEEYVLSEGRNGYINETYLQRWENGIMVYETLVSRDTYEAKPMVIYVGTKNPALPTE